jgi:hypothetical protein
MSVTTNLRRVTSRKGEDIVMDSSQLTAEPFAVKSILLSGLEYDYRLIFLLLLVGGQLPACRAKFHHSQCDIWNYTSVLMSRRWLRLQLACCVNADRL